MVHYNDYDCSAGESSGHHHHAMVFLAETGLDYRLNNKYSTVVEKENS